MAARSFIKNWADHQTYQYQLFIIVIQTYVLSVSS